MKKTSLKSTLFSLLLVLLGLILLFIVLVLVQELFNVKIFNFDIVWVMNNEMDPTIEYKDFILVKDIDPSTLKQYDVIAYTCPNRGYYSDINVGRISEVLSNSNFITQGDNPLGGYSDSVNGSQVIGIMVTKLSILTSFIKFFLTTPGLIVSLVVIVALFIFFQILSNKLVDKSSKETEENVK